MNGSESVLAFDVIYTYLVAIAIAMTRPIAVFSVLPIITRLGLPELLKYAIAMVLSLHTISALVANPAALQSMSPMFIAFIALKETLIGVTLGIIISAPFWAIEMSGDILDFIRQAPDASIQDPQGTTESSLSGTLFSIFAILIFLSSGGLTIITGLIYSSYDLWPAHSNFPVIDTAAPIKLLSLLDYMFKTALLVAAPLLLLLLLSFAILAIIAKFVPQINVFDMSMILRNITYFVMIQIYIVYITSYYFPELGTIKSSLSYLERLLNGG